jgi:hypothetical protein
MLEEKKARAPHSPPPPPLASSPPPYGRSEPLAQPVWSARMVAAGLSRPFWMAQRPVEPATRRSQQWLDSVTFYAVVALAGRAPGILVVAAFGVSRPPWVDRLTHQICLHWAKALLTLGALLMGRVRRCVGWHVGLIDAGSLG